VIAQKNQSANTFYDYAKKGLCNLRARVLLPLRLIKPFRIVVTFRLIIDSGLQKGLMLNHTNGVLRASSLFRALHVSAVTEPRATIVIPNKTGKKFPKYYLQPT
jgi:hypothetical protein